MIRVNELVIIIIEAQGNIDIALTHNEPSI